MTRPLHLIQLVSEQTMPNLLPILRLRPASVTHLVTPRTAARSRHLGDAARAAGIHLRIDVVNLSAMPGIPETCGAVNDAISQARENGGSPVLNFTGGTKLMSIGAYAAAMQTKIPSFYVDTQDDCFVNGGASPEMAVLLDNDWSFTPLRNQIRVDTLAIANGVERVTGGKSWKDALPLARHLFDHHADEAATHEAFHGPAGIFPHGREPRTPADWVKALDRPIPLPPAVGKAATALGLLRDSGGGFLLPDAPREELQHLAANKVPNFHVRYFGAVAPLQAAATFLTGGWWEVIVAEAMAAAGLFRDIRWSCHVGQREGPDMEEDILAVDGVQLAYVSCKRGGAKAKLLPLLEEVRSRANRIGGTFTRRFLAVCEPPRGRTSTNLQQRARELGVHIVTRETVRSPSAFLA